MSKAYNLESYVTSSPQNILGIRVNNQSFVGRTPIDQVYRLRVGSLAANSSKRLNTTPLNFDFEPVCILWSNEPNNANQGTITFNLYEANNTLVGSLDFNVVSQASNGFFYIPSGSLNVLAGEYITVTSQFTINSLFVNIKPIIITELLV